MRPPVPRFLGFISFSLLLFGLSSGGGQRHTPGLNTLHTTKLHPVPNPSIDVLEMQVESRDPSNVHQGPSIDHCDRSPRPWRRDWAGCRGRRASEHDAVAPRKRRNCPSIHALTTSKRHENKEMYSHRGGCRFGLTNRGLSGCKKLRSRRDF